MLNISNTNISRKVSKLGQIHFLLRGNAWQGQTRKQKKKKLSTTVSLPRLEMGSNAKAIVWI